MASAETYQNITVEDYLKSEETAPIRREYVDGRVFLMTGANRRHNKIAGNIFAKLHALLEGTDCTPFIHDMKVRVEAANCFYYPDVMVSCNEFADEAIYTEKPVLIIEVMSASTAVTDRREKLANYTKIPSVREYMLVHQRRMRIECHRKSADGVWTKCEYVLGDNVVFESMTEELTVAVAAIYRDAFQSKGMPAVREEKADYCFSNEEVALDW